MQLTQSLVTDGNTCSVESRKSCMQLFSGTLPQQAEITKKMENWMNFDLCYSTDEMKQFNDKPGQILWHLNHQNNPCREYSRIHSQDLQLDEFHYCIYLKTNY